MARLPEGAPKELEKYLTPQERIVFVIRRHWLSVAEPVSIWLAALGIVILLAIYLPDSVLVVLDVSIWVFLAVTLWAGWQVLDWWVDRFTATNRRLLLTYGIITRKVAMMPMSKVTDMSYNRTVPGRIFGYGEFVLESAGQDQALSNIEFVPNPDFYYRIISTEIFAPESGSGSAGMMGSGPGGNLPPTQAEPAWWRRA